MNRRNAAIVLAVLGLTPLFALAQQPSKVWRVGFLSPRNRPSALDSDVFGAFQKGMLDLGYVVGKNLVIEWRFAEGKFERLSGLAAELVQLKVDVIIAASGTSTGAAQKATTTVPIVMTSVSDPVSAGFAKSLSRPGGNITGLTNLSVDLSSKQLEMLVGIVPRLKSVAILANPANSTHAITQKNIQSAAQKVHVAVTPVNAITLREIEGAFSAMTDQKAGALIVLADQHFREQRFQIAALAIKHRMPTALPNREFAEAGGLMSYGPNVLDTYRRAATYVDKILRGAKPADLPIEQPTKFKLVINRKTAKELGLTIPQSLLLQADEVIE